MKRLIFALFILSQCTLFAQKKAADIKPSDFKKLQILEDNIASVAKIAVQDSLANNRLVANNQLLALVKEALSIPNSFNYAFTKVENISIQKPTDGAFRTFTWQLYVNENQYKYFGYVQLNRTKSTIFELVDESTVIERPESQVLAPNHWFGAVYYNIKEFKTPDGMKYLLFGFNAHDQYEKIKVCDVLVLRGGQIKFGAPVLEIADVAGMKKQKFNRLILNYSAEASMRLNYDPEMGIVIHDHLEQMKTKNPISPFSYVPDGTYEAFELRKDGIWSHVDKLANTEMKTAPRPAPTLNSRNRVKSARENAKNFDWPEEVKKGKTNN